MVKKSKKQYKNTIKKSSIPVPISSNRKSIKNDNENKELVKSNKVINNNKVIKASIVKDDVRPEGNGKKLKIPIKKQPIREPIKETIKEPVKAVQKEDLKETIKPKETLYEKASKMADRFETGRGYLNTTNGLLQTISPIVNNEKLNSVSHAVNVVTGGVSEIPNLNNFFKP